MHRLEQKCDNLQSELQNGNVNKVKSIPSDSNMTYDSKFMDTLDLDDLLVCFFYLYNTVKPLYNEHPRDLVKCVHYIEVLHRLNCYIFRGHS